MAVVMADSSWLIVLVLLVGGAAAYSWYQKEYGGALKGSKIKERWEILVPDGGERANAIFESVRAELEHVRPPEVEWERREIHAGGVFTGKRYDFLAVRNAHLRDFRLYLTAYPYGTSLHVAWFLTIEQRFLKRMLGIFLFWYAGLDDPKHLSYRLDIPKQLELSAYTRVVHQAAKGAVKGLMQELKQDFSVVDTKSKGFLELW